MAVKGQKLSGLTAKQLVCELSSRTALASHWPQFSHRFSEIFSVYLVASEFIEFLSHRCLSNAEDSPGSAAAGT